MNYYIKYFGCDMNKSDSERVSSIFESMKMKKTENISEADVIAILACSVRQSAVNRVYEIFRKKKIKKSAIRILTGCVLKKDTQKLQKIFDIIIDITRIKDLPKIIKENKFYSYNPENVEYFDIIPRQKNNFSALIPISNGCNQFCTYCAVPYTRGIEKNRSAYSILSEIKQLPQNIKQITLLGQTVNSYINPDKNSKIKNFSDLLETVAKLKKDTWIGFTSPYPTKFTDKLIKIIAKYNNISNHIHIPLQSGSDKILKLMNRKYTSYQFLEIINKIYKLIPDANITTDVIVGFCNETEKDFSDTLDVLKKSKITLVYSGLYSPRPETLAYKIYNDNVSQSTKRKRDEKMTKLIGKQSLERNKKYLGNVVKVLVSSKSKKGIYLGKMQTHETVKIFNATDYDLGRIVNVKIDKTLEWGLEGKIIK
ncbi:MAG: MiaB/RimO family radical SAM methylthiotransferase [Patescibacteria group bacterium]|nr:MiaB/RimO family radical SAM methylthiotransferase [Patescibacteria group bacterium]